MKRRSFVEKTAALAALPLVPSPTTVAPMKEAFVHHVYFWLKNPTSQTDRDALVAGLRKLSQVPTIKFHHIGVPAPTNREVIERGYQISWLCLFPDGAAEEVYQKHPIHLKFVADCQHLWEKVTVYDSIQIA